MTEFLIVSAAWVVLLVSFARNGTAHYRRAHVAVTLPVVGGVVAAVLEALPAQPISPGFTLRTVIAVAAGVFGGRLLARAAGAWAANHEKRAAEHPGTKPPRLVHPLVAAGMAVAGVPVIWHLVAAEHALVEEMTTPRDGATGIVHGCEEVADEAGGSRAVLLLHSLFGSPADFGELPMALREHGLTVHAPLLPGHGRVPSDAERVWAEDYVKAARRSFDALAAKHADVAIVGSSMGGTLALLVGEERKPTALVLVDPFVGRFAKPRWSPVEVETLIGPLSRVVQFALRGEDVRGVGYCTLSLHALRQERDVARRLPADRVKLPVAPLVLLSPADDVSPAAATREWLAAHLDDPALVEDAPVPRETLFRDRTAARPLVERIVAGVARGR